MTPSPGDPLPRLWPSGAGGVGQVEDDGGVGGLVADGAGGGVDEGGVAVRHDPVAWGGGRRQSGDIRLVAQQQNLKPRLIKSSRFWKKPLMFFHVNSCLTAAGSDACF